MVVTSHPAVPRKATSLRPNKNKSCRNKTGCHMCRLRGKKCDENKSPDTQSCDACRRLKLPCISWGPRRPDWLRIKENAKEAKRRIKEHLVLLGKIKGHPGSSGRPSSDALEHVLSFQDLISPPLSPASPLNDCWTSHQLTPEASSTYTGNFFYADEYPRYGAETTPLYSFPAEFDDMSTSSSLSSSSSPSLPFSGLYAPSNATLHSASSVYHTALDMNTPLYTLDDPDVDNMYDAVSLYPDPTASEHASMSMAMNTPQNVVAPSPLPSLPLQLGSWDDYLLQHYFTYVFPIQYRLADPDRVKGLIYSLSRNRTTMAAICLLSTVHQTCLTQSSYWKGELDKYLKIANETLLGTNAQVGEGEAMAALQLISACLFDGARGPWPEYLKVPSEFLRRTLLAGMGPREVLKNAPESTQFIILTTIWFDVLGNITRGTTPALLEIYEQLFSSASTEGSDLMRRVMGCEGTIMLALARTAELAAWKEQQAQKHSLSIPELVRRGEEIKRKYLLLSCSSSRSFSGSSSARAAEPPWGLSTDDDQQLEIQREKVANVFRAAAKVYLSSVVSGSFPHVEETVNAVEETIATLQALGPSLIDRSVVFAMTIAGCMTNNPAHRSFLLNRLRGLGQEAELVGNCGQARRLMERVWQKQDRDKGSIPCWRQTMKEMNMELLLV